MTYSLCVFGAGLASHPRSSTSTQRPTCGVLRCSTKSFASEGPAALSDPDRSVSGDVRRGEGDLHTMSVQSRMKLQSSGSGVGCAQTDSTRGNIDGMVNTILAAVEQGSYSMDDVEDESDSSSRVWRSNPLNTPSSNGRSSRSYPLEGSRSGDADDENSSCRDSEGYERTNSTRTAVYSIDVDNMTAAGMGRRGDGRGVLAGGLTELDVDLGKGLGGLSSYSSGVQSGDDRFVIAKEGSTHADAVGEEPSTAGAGNATTYALLYMYLRTYVSVYVINLADDAAPVVPVWLQWDFLEDPLSACGSLAQTVPAAVGRREIFPEKRLEQLLLPQHSKDRSPRVVRTLSLHIHTTRANAAPYMGYIYGTMSDSSRLVF